MQKIIPHLWFNTEAKAATALYATLFPGSAVTNIRTIHDTPSGDCDIVSFRLVGMECMAISAGPYFKLNPSISFFVQYENEADIQRAWDALVKGGKVLMPLDTYPWAAKYGWLQDAYGVSWQLSYTAAPAPDAAGGAQGSATVSVVKPDAAITPALMFTQAVAGKAREAMDFYASLFPNSHVDVVVPYEKGDGDTEGFVKHARFTLAGQHFMALDSSAPHAFTFNEAFSLLVKCDTQAEIDELWAKLSAVPDSEQCGWLKDKYGVSWQITPTRMDDMMSTGTPEQIDRVTQAFLKMKKFDIATLEVAFRG